MKCSSCGAELNGQKICPRCGARQSVSNNNVNKPKIGKEGGKSVGAIFGLVATIIVVLVIGIFGVSKVTNTDIISMIAGGSKGNSKGGGNRSGKLGSDKSRRNGGKNSDYVYNENDFEVFEYDDEKRTIGSRNKTNNKTLTYYNTPIENINFEDNEVIYANNELMVSFKSGTDLKTVESTMQKYGGKVVGINDYISMYQIQFDKSYNFNGLNDLIEKVSKESNIESACVNAGIFEGNLEKKEEFNLNDAEYKNVTEWDSTYPKNWWLLDINAKNMWDIMDKVDTERVNVGIIDSGIYDGHKDLSMEKDRYYVKDEKGKEYEIDAERYKKSNIKKIKNELQEDGSSHGTHVAGIIGAKKNNEIGVAGVASNVSSIYVMPSLWYVPSNKGLVKEASSSQIYLTYLDNEDWMLNPISSGVQFVNNINSFKNEYKNLSENERKEIFGNLNDDEKEYVEALIKKEWKGLTEKDIEELTKEKKEEKIEKEIIEFLNGSTKEVLTYLLSILTSGWENESNESWNKSLAKFDKEDQEFFTLCREKKWGNIPEENMRGFLVRNIKKIKEETIYNLVPTITNRKYGDNDNYKAIYKETYSIGNFAYEIYALTELINVKKCKVVNISQYWAIKDKVLFAHIQKSFTETLKKFIDNGNDFIIVKAAGNSTQDCTYSDYNGDGILRHQILEQIGNKELIDNKLIEVDDVKNRIIIVGSSDINHSSSYFSNYGSRVDIFAPGSKIYSCIYNNIETNKSDYWYMSGTSMAAPVITGVVANMFAVSPELKAAEVKKILQSTGTRSIMDKGGFNHKIVNAYEAVKYLINNDYTTDVPEKNGIKNISGIDYKVLVKDEDTGEALLVAEEGVEAVPYYIKDIDDKSIRTKLSWSDSYLKTWLNNQYYDSLDEDVKNAIVSKEIDKTDGNNIFILSKAELVEYFGKGKDNEYTEMDSFRQLKPSKNANGAYVCPKDYETLGGKIKLVKDNTVYWVRDASTTLQNTNMMVVNAGGTISTEGVDASGDFKDINGVSGRVCVRPAMWVRFKIIEK